MFCRRSRLGNARDSDSGDDRPPRSWLSACVAMLAVAAGLAATPVAAAADGAVATAYSRLPLAFAPNGGQTDRRV
ncbi:MAG: hypothetical protein QOI80_2376, partial [Solirubrobacteraceae bacterium]|nr:hypothetical protein [Solirubrobacteraceae bacterium]